MPTRLLRVAVARDVVEAGLQTFDEIAHNVGFSSAGRMRRAFLRPGAAATITSSIPSEK